MSRNSNTLISMSLGSSPNEETYYKIKGSWLTALATKIRAKFKITGLLSLAQIFSRIDDLYYSEDGWGVGSIFNNTVTEYHVKEGITVLPSYLFDGCTQLNTISLPSTLINLGEATFKSCSSLTNVELPDGITELPTLCFNNCQTLTSINLPDSITSIGGNCFTSAKITNYLLPSNIQTIAGYSFRGTRVAFSDFPASLTKIEGYAFYACGNLTNITFHGTPNSIASTAFYGCGNITDIHILYLYRCQRCHGLVEE